MADIAQLRSDLEDVNKLLETMAEGPGKMIVAKKKERAEKALNDALAEESSTTEVAVEVEQKPTPKPKKEPKKAKAEPKEGGKALRYVFERPHASSTEDAEVIERKVVRATSKAEAEGMLGDAKAGEVDWDFIKTISRGKSPKEGLISLAPKKKVGKKKAPSSKAKEASVPASSARLSKESREDMAKSAGLSDRKAKAESDKVAGAKKRARKTTKKKAYLFEMPMKTQAGKVKRKVVLASSQESAEKSAGKNYNFVREVRPNENPKTGVVGIEGYVAPPKRSVGRPKGSSKKTSVSTPDPEPTTKSKASVKAKSEGTGQGMGMTKRALEQKIADSITAIALISQELEKLSSEVADMVSIVASMDKKMARGGKTTSKTKVVPVEEYGAFYAMEDDGTLWTRPMMSSEPDDFIPPFDWEGDDEWGVVSAFAFDERERESFDAEMMDIFGKQPKLEDDFGDGGISHEDVAPKFSHVYSEPKACERFGTHCMIACEDGRREKVLYITPTYNDGSYDSDEWTRASSDWISSPDMADDFNEEMENLFGRDYQGVVNKAKSEE